MKQNPYVGPRPYERGEANFYGRNRETRDLLSLILAERVVLFYAQSGAGKTSLLNAQIIPALEEEGFNVLPMARVGSALPPSISNRDVKNIFVFSALMGLAEAAPVRAVLTRALTYHTLLTFLRTIYLGDRAETHRKDRPAILAVDSALRDFYEPREKSSPEDRPPLLIFDQFEELFTTHQGRWQDARGFFEQLREALLRIPTLGIVFAMREDHVAAMDPHARLLPGRLRARFRMERLSYEGAVAAVRRPAESVGMRFGQGVAERLVDDLRRIRTARARDEPGEAEDGTLLGPYIEPVQLQVVCTRLWENLPAQKDNAILWEEVERFGDIDRALIDFYENAMARVIAQTGVGERRLRHWFESKLITSMQTRGLALREEKETAGLSNAAVDILEAQHIIRADMRAGARWYELAHDRMVEPVMESNRIWKAERRTPFHVAVEHWLERGQDQSMLFRGEALREAQEWAESHLAELTPDEEAFLAESRRVERRRRRLRLLVVGGMVASVLIIILISGLAIAAMNASTRAIELAATADAARDQAEARGTELVRSEATVVAASTASYLNLREAWRQQSLFLADLSQQQLMDGSSQDALLLAQEALFHYPEVVNRESFNALLDALTDPIQETAYFQHRAAVVGAAWSADEKRVLSWSNDGTARVWATDGGDEALLTLRHDGRVGGAAWMGEDRILSWCYGQIDMDTGAPTGSNAAWVWDADTGEALLTLRHADEMRGAAWPEAGAHIYTWGLDGVRVWDADDGQPLLYLPHEKMQSVAWSEDWSHLITVTIDWTARESRLRGWQLHEHLEAEEQFDIVYRNYASVDLDAGGMRALVWNNNRLSVLDAKTGSEQFFRSFPDLRGAAWSPDERDIMVWMTEEIEILDAGSGETTVLPDADMVWELIPVSGAMWSPDGDYLLAWSWMGNVAVFDTELGFPILSMFNPMPLQIADAAWLPDGAHIAVWSDKGMEVSDLYPEGNFESVKGLLLPHHQSTGGALSADARRAITWGQEGSIKVWRLVPENDVPLITLPPVAEPLQEQHIVGWYIDSEAHRMLGISDQGKKRQWDLPPDVARYAPDLAGRPQKEAGHTVIWSTGGDRVLYWSDAGRLVIFDGDTGEALLRREFASSVLGARWSPDETRVLYWLYDNTAHMLDVETGESRQVAAYAGSREGAIGGGAWTTGLAGEAWAAIWSNDDPTAYIVEAHSGDTLELVHEGPLGGARWEGARLLTWSNPAFGEACEEDTCFEARIWALEAGPSLAGEVVLSHEAPVNDAIWDADGQHVVTASGKEALVWDIERAETLSRLVHVHDILRVTRSPAGTYLSVHGADSVHVWQTEPTPRRLLALNFSKGADQVPEAAWSPDGSRLLAWARGEAHVADPVAARELLVLHEGDMVIQAGVWGTEGHFVFMWHEQMMRIWLTDIETLLVLGEAQKVRELNNMQRERFFLTTREPTVTPDIPTVTPLPTFTPVEAE